ncbi:MAG: thiamine diphosphokinase [Clostridia bacterium]|nr:thiamine diphosphokinase [Clostridia bacterium]
MKDCIIFGAGEYDAQQPEKSPETLVIAADAGYRRCAACGFVPDFAIGDFDSLCKAPDLSTVIRLPVEKDVTDMDAAVALALEHGCKVIHLYGGMGGRPDHTLANYSLIARLSQQGVSAYLYGNGYTVAAVTDGALTLTGGRGETVSVFSWTDRSEGVTLRGLKYPLENAVLTSAFALGVSNSFTEETATVSVEHGTLLVMREYLPG